MPSRRIIISDVLVVSDVKPKRRSWILVFSRKERKDRKGRYNPSVLRIIQTHLPSLVFTNWVNCCVARTVYIIKKNIPSLSSLRSLRLIKIRRGSSTAVFRLNQIDHAHSFNGDSAWISVISHDSANVIAADGRCHLGAELLVYVVNAYFP